MLTIRLDAADFISISTMFSCLKEIPRGNRAILVSVTDFYPGVQLAKRRGAKRDTKRLHKILYKLGFQVDVYEDLSAEETYEVFEAASRESVEDCFVGVISSHGEEGLVFGVDGKAVKLAQIFNLFSNPAMDGKTKLFFVQACRGVDLDPGVETDSAEDDKEDSFSHLLSIPMDSAVVFATSPGYSAFMHPLGSVFLQTLCDLLEMEGGQDLEVTQLLTRLNYRVAYGFEARGPQLAGKKEMPCFVSRLTRQTFPFSMRETELWGIHQYLPDEPQMRPEGTVYDRAVEWDRGPRRS